ncbi:MAG: type II CAAX endopeptidase family protein [Verrucomicrobiota bacterium]|jgi:membrane protease YdiL (CAAX protease family)
MLATKPWRIDAVGRLFLAILATYCLGMTLASLLDKVTSAWPKAESDFLQILLGLIFLQFSALVWITLFLRRHAIGWTDAFGLRLSEPVTAAAYGILAGVLFLPVGLGLTWLSGYLMELVHQTPQAQAAVQALQDSALSLRDKITFGLAVIVVAPVAEEALFRGILYTTVKQMGYPRLALWGSSALFAVMHVNEPTLMPLLVFALVLVYLYESYENLLAPIAAHSLFNAANFFYLIFEDQFNRLLHLT